MQRIDALVIFAKVGELGSISGAARALALPKANVSRAVARLEADYGVCLIERSTRRIVLTEVGRKIHMHCVRLMAGLEEVSSEAAAYRGVPSGTLRAGCPTSMAVYLAEWLPEFFDLHPTIDLRLKVADRLLPEPYGFDVVLHVGWLADSALVARKIADLPNILVASRDYVARHGVPNDPRELSSHAVIGFYYGDRELRVAHPGELPARVPQLELSWKGESHLPRIWRRFATNDPAVMLNSALNGLAITPLARVVTRDHLASGALVQILPGCEIVDPPALYAIHAGRSPPPKVRAFTDFVAEQVRILVNDQSTTVPVTEH